MKQSPNHFHSQKQTPHAVQHKHLNSLDSSIHLVLIMFHFHNTTDKTKTDENTQCLNKSSAMIVVTQDQNACTRASRLNRDVINRTRSSGMIELPKQGRAIYLQVQEK